MAKKKSVSKKKPSSVKKGASRLSSQKSGTTKKTTAKKANSKSVPEAAGKSSYLTPGADKGAASIVLCYYGDSKFTTFFQETQPLNKAFKDYKFKVLLKHNEIPSGLDLNERDEKNADVIEKPTKENLIKYIKQLTADGYIIDLWILSHGSTSGFRVSKGKFGQNETCTISYLKSNLSPSVTGYTKIPIRMVYQGTCYGSALNSAWRGIGAKVVCGARYVNFYPLQFKKFAGKWEDGKSFGKALSDSNTAATRTLVQTYILGHATSKRKDWGGCPFGKTVLGKHSCARKYFTKYWQETDEWQNSKSGKENMNYSSTMMRSGDTGITKNTRLSW